MTGSEVCAVCEGVARQVEAVRPVKVGRRSVRVLDAFVQCDDCGEEYYLPGQMEESQRRASAALAAGSGALDPTKVRAVRERLGVTQGELERLLGVGPKTVVRWERGTVRPNAATDRLLRLVRDIPGVAAYLAAAHGVALPAREATQPARESTAPVLAWGDVLGGVDAWGSPTGQVVSSPADVVIVPERRSEPPAPASVPTRVLTVRRHLDDMGHGYLELAADAGV